MEPSKMSWPSLLACSLLLALLAAAPAYARVPDLSPATFGEVPADAGDEERSLPTIPFNAVSRLSGLPGFSTQAYGTGDWIDAVHSSAYADVEDAYAEMDAKVIEGVSSFQEEIDLRGCGFQASEPCSPDDAELVLAKLEAEAARVIENRYVETVFDYCCQGSFFGQFVSYAGSKAKVNGRYDADEGVAIVEVSGIVPSYTAPSGKAVSAEQARSYKEEYEAAIADIVSQVPQGLDEAHKVKWVHDWLLLHCAYDYGSLNGDSADPDIGERAWTGYGAVCQGYAVCVGFAAANRDILEACGIECDYVEEAYDGIGHVWNRVKVDGEWYNEDVTWDACKSSDEETAYFLKSDRWWRDHPENGLWHRSWSPAGQPATSGKYDDARWERYNKIPLSACDIVPTGEPCVFNGKEHYAAFSVSYRGENLCAADYEYSGYADNVHAGTAIATIVGCGSVEGTVEIPFEILPLEMDASYVGGIPASKYRGAGSPVVVPVVERFDGRSNLALTEGEDYRVECGEGMSGGYVSISGMGDYTGTVTTCFDLLDRPAPSSFEGVAASAGFADLDASSWYMNTVSGAFPGSNALYMDYAIGSKMMKGYDDGRFGPQDPVTRGQVLTVLYRLDNPGGGEDVEHNRTPFGDIGSFRYYTAAVNWAWRSGIAKGYGDGSFRPDEPVTREQLAALVQRYCERFGAMGEGAAGSIAFADADRISAWAADAVAYCSQHGIMTGYDDRRFGPQDAFTRCQMAKVASIVGNGGVAA